MVSAQFLRGKILEEGHMVDMETARRRQRGERSEGEAQQEDAAWAVHYKEASREEGDQFGKWLSLG